MVLDESDTTRFRLSIGKQSREATATSKGKDTVQVDFGSFTIDSIGHQWYYVDRARRSGTTIGDRAGIVAGWPGTKDVHFNMKERRNAASVHLVYPVDKQVEVEAFSCEVTAIEDPVTTYYMATGWHRGYFGMQVNSPKERRIIFSVWTAAMKRLVAIKLLMTIE